MNKKTLIIVLVVVAILGLGAGAYFLTSSDNESGNNEATETAQSELSESSTDQPTFNPQSTVSESFTATMTGTSDGETFTATIEYDGDNNSRYTGQANDKEFDLYLLGDRNIFCSDGQCLETPNSAGLVPVDKDQYEISEDDLASYQQSALYKGQVDCSAGTCDKWEVSVSTFTGSILVDSSGRINQVTTVSENSNYTIDYVYEEVVITPPENVKSIPSLQ